jgi:hypothetical protein
VAILGVLLCVAAATFAVLAPAGASTPHNPIGSLDVIQQTATGIAVYGWDADADSPTTSMAAALTVNGARVGMGVTAALPRPDVARVFPSFGPNHGFKITLPMTAGTYTICVRAGNVGPGVITVIGCRATTVSFDPAGVLMPVTALGHGQFTAVGTATDVSTLGPITVDVTLDNAPLAHLTANLPAGGGHGFSVTHAVAQGRHTLCVVGTNVGTGANKLIGCQSFTLDESPVGGLLALHQVPSGIALSGWASDPDTSAPISVQVTVDGTLIGTATASSTSTTHPGHTFVTQILNRINVPGNRLVCVTGVNVSFGVNRAVACQRIALNYNPTSGLDSAVQTRPGSGVTVTGWATDPDTASPLTVTITADGTLLGHVVAGGAGGAHPGHMFTASYPLGQGTHLICASAANALSGTGPSPQSCRSVALNFNPFGRFVISRAAGSTNLAGSGWAIDPNTVGPVTVVMTVDGPEVTRGAAGIARSDVAGAYPQFGANHGFALSSAATANEHKVCLTAINIALGNSVQLGCAIVNAVHPVVPSAPTAVQAVGGFGSATVSWHAPASDGGAPWTSYTVTAMPGGVTQTVGATSTSALVPGLKSNAVYVFTVVARNIAGVSPGAVSPATRTQSSPPPQTLPAPVSTSRYIRNISGAAGDPTKMHAEGVADALANPSGHGYLVLLDIGGQDQADGGVVLSASVQFVTYPTLVANIEAYVSGYASVQRPSAPVVIAIGTNNDMDVSATTGVNWAQLVVNPVRAYAAAHPSITIAGANDIEPGFRAGYTASKSWLQGYLSATSAPFVFNGSADGCSWSSTGAACNNGWSMGGLYYLAGGAGSTRIVNLPQIYNNTMAAQWKYISLTGVAARQPRINFGGALTEWTACSQSGGCGSLTGHEAWTAMWNQLQSVPALHIGSLPYSTDLRIDR